MNEKGIIKKRQEILFLYDVSFCNPNGDPLDENKPRIDIESGRNIVTDVRLKRTIRDYLFNFEGFDGGESGKGDILIREIRTEKDTVKDMKTRAKDFGKTKDEIKKNILSKCVDVRLFGATIALDETISPDNKKDSITFTGPVQFEMGVSLNKTDIVEIGHSFVMAGKSNNAKQGSLASEYVIPYSLIAFHGVINENAAKETNLTEEDVKLLDKGIWNGTKNLITRSKAGQTPRLLIRIEYKEGNFHIGELNRYIRIKAEDEEKIRSTNDYSLDITELKKILTDNKDKIEKIFYLYNGNLRFEANGSSGKLEDLLRDTQIKLEKIPV